MRIIAGNQSFKIQKPAEACLTNLCFLLYFLSTALYGGGIGFITESFQDLNLPANKLISFPSSKNKFLFNSQFLHF